MSASRANLLNMIAATSANADAPQNCHDGQGAVWLSCTDDQVLDEGEALGRLEVDPKGNLGIDLETIRSVVRQLVDCMNEQFRQTRSQAEEIEALQRYISELKQAAGEHQQIIYRLEPITHEHAEAVRDLTTQVTSLVLEVKDKQVKRGSPDDDESDWYQNQLHTTNSIERLEESLYEMGSLKKKMEQQIDSLSSRVSETDARLHKVQRTLELDVFERFRLSDATLLALKVDIDTVRNYAMNNQRSKATKAELQKQQVQIDNLMRSHHLEASVLEEARENFGKLQEFIEQAGNNKCQVLDVRRLMQSEFQCMRDWASKSFYELREQLLTKAEDISLQTRFNELRAALSESAERCLAETAALAEGMARRKADVGDVARLKESLQSIQGRKNFPHQLLLGSRCLSCDRSIDMSGDGVTDEGCVELEQARQQAELFNHVQRSLAKLPAGPGGKLGTDTLKFVAVRVGSPQRVAAAGGIIEARHDIESEDDFDLSTFSILSTPRPHSVQSTRNDRPAERVPLAPPRPPAHTQLVRMNRSRPASRAAASPTPAVATLSNSAFARGHATAGRSERSRVGQSLREALAVRPATVANSPSEARPPGV